MIQRRQFLAAAAALAVLPQTANADSPAPHEIVEDRSVMDDRTKSLTDCGSVPGSLNNVHVTADMNGGPFEVEEVHEEVTGVASDFGGCLAPLEVGTGLEPDDACDLAARLVVDADTAEGGSMTDDARVTTHIVRTDDGENYTEYRVGGVSYPSSEAVKAALEAR